MAGTTCTCDCHTGPYAPCSTPGGCGSAGCGRQPDWNTHHCRAGQHCKAFDHIAQHPAYITGHVPLCDPCLTAAAQDIGTLVYDYVDLAQLQAPTLSQAADGQPGAKADPPMPIKGAPDALQREIHHVLTTWEVEVRAATRLPDLTPPPQHGAAVQRAATILQPRIRELAALPATAVYPTGCEDPTTDVTGWEAVQHLTRLHARARAMLGRTQRTYWIPGECPNEHCRSRTLYRADPRHERDQPAITCDTCRTQRTPDDYQTYVTTLQWPTTMTAAA